MKRKRPTEAPARRPEDIPYVYPRTIENKGGWDIFSEPFIEYFVLGAQVLSNSPRLVGTNAWGFAAQSVPCEVTFTDSRSGTYPFEATYMKSIFDVMRAQPWLVKLSLHHCTILDRNCDDLVRLLRECPNIQSLEVQDCSRLPKPYDAEDHVRDCLELGEPRHAIRVPPHLPAKVPLTDRDDPRAWDRLLDYIRSSTTLRRLMWVRNHALPGFDANMREALAANRSIIYLEYYEQRGGSPFTNQKGMMARDPIHEILRRNTTLQYVTYHNMILPHNIQDLLEGPLHRHPSVRYVDFNCIAPPMSYKGVLAMFRAAVRARLRRFIVRVPGIDSGALWADVSEIRAQRDREIRAERGKLALILRAHRTLEPGNAFDVLPPEILHLVGRHFVAQIPPPPRIVY